MWNHDMPLHAIYSRFHNLVVEYFIEHQKELWQISFSCSFVFGLGVNGMSLKLKW